MNEAKAGNWKPEAAALRVWRTPKIRTYAVCIALMLPGSFLVLPLLWIWQRSRMRLSPSNRVDQEGSQS